MPNDESNPNLDLDGADRDATQLKVEHKPTVARAKQQHHGTRRRQRPARDSRRKTHKPGGGKKR